MSTKELDSGLGNEASSDVKQVYYGAASESSSEDEMEMIAPSSLPRRRWLKLKYFWKLEKAKHAERVRAKAERLQWEEELKRDQKLMARFAVGDIADNVLSVMSSRKTNKLISGKDVEVPISYLKGKVLGLYFYSDMTSHKDISELKHMYQKLREKGENFELVFVCLHRQRPLNCANSELLTSYEKSVEEKFARYFRGSTWLGLPFSQTESNHELYRWWFLSNCGKNADLINNQVYQAWVIDKRRPTDTDFVIIQPGQKVHTLAMSIYIDYGIEAYPFSESRVAEIEVARFKSLTLDELLFSGADEKFVYDQDGHKISATHLVGKKILLFLTRVTRCRGETEQKVIDWYIDRKRHDQAFEMIRVFYLTDGNQDPDLKKACKRRNREMSWLEYPYDEYDMDALYSKLLKKKCSYTYCYVQMCLAFGDDGRFITMKTLSPRFGYSDNIDKDLLNLFDANEGDLCAQVRKYNAIVNDWSSNEKTGWF